MKIPQELIDLSNKATPGEWSWDDSGINTNYNPSRSAFSGRDPIYQRVLWPDNSLDTDTRSVSEVMGACGTDTEVQAEANQQLLVAAVNYVRQLIQQGESK